MGVKVCLADLSIMVTGEVIRHICLYVILKPIINEFFENALLLNYQEQSKVRCFFYKFLFLIEIQPLEWLKGELVCHLWLTGLNMAVFEQSPLLICQIRRQFNLLWFTR